MNGMQVLETAANPQMQVIISNTTEVGITLIKDNVHATPPQSFPGKLLSFLYRRFKIFNGDATKGMVVIPTELILEMQTNYLPSCRNWHIKMIWKHHFWIGLKMPTISVIHLWTGSCRVSPLWLNRKR